MARPRTSGYTDNELLIMKALWEEAPLSIASILERLPRKPKPAYTSVLTVVQAMEKKGYVRHKQVGKAYLYEPTLKKSDFEKTEVAKAAKRIFNADPMGLAINLVKNEHLSKDELRKLKKLLDQL